MPLLDISKTYMNFGMNTLNQIIKTKEKYDIWILTAFLFKLKLKSFAIILLTILKDGLTHLTMMIMIKDHLQ